MFHTLTIKTEHKYHLPITNYDAYSVQSVLWESVPRSQSSSLICKFVFLLTHTRVRSTIPNRKFHFYDEMFQLMFGES